MDHVAVPVAHPLTAREVVEAHDLEGEPVLLVDHTDAPTAHEETIAYSAALGVQPAWVLHPATQAERMLDMVALGTGIGWLNRWQAEQVRRDDVAVRGSSPSRASTTSTWCATSATGRRPSPPSSRSPRSWTTRRRDHPAVGLFTPPAMRSCAVPCPACRPIPPCSIAESAARAAGAVLRDGQRRPKEVVSKGRTDIVTWADGAAQTAVVEVIAAAFPDDRIVGEEGTVGDASAARTWIVDPLDGTSNYAHGIPFFCVSVTVRETDGPLLAGAVYDPLHNGSCSRQSTAGRRRWRCRRPPPSTAPSSPPASRTTTPTPSPATGSDWSSCTGRATACAYSAPPR